MKLSVQFPCDIQVRIFPDSLGILVRINEDVMFYRCYCINRVAVGRNLNSHSIPTYFLWEFPYDSHRSPL